jgi:hypothetical protein
VQKTRRFAGVGPQKTHLHRAIRLRALWTVWSVEVRVFSGALEKAPLAWSAEIANERGGYSRRLPDLVFWPPPDRWRQAAVVIAPRLTNPRRERAALQDCQRSISAGQYAPVHFLVGSAFVSHLRRVAEDIGLTAPQLIVGERVIADKLPLHALVIENVDEGSAA